MDIIYVREHFIVELITSVTDKWWSKVGIGCLLADTADIMLFAQSNEALLPPVCAPGKLELVISIIASYHQCYQIDFGWAMVENSKLIMLEIGAININCDGPSH